MCIAYSGIILASRQGRLADTGMTTDLTRENGRARSRPAASGKIAPQSDRTLGDVGMALFGSDKSVSLMTNALSRSEIIRRGRIAILDDDIPEMLKDLRSHGLSIDHLVSTDDPAFGRLSEAFYDLLLLDYGGIGSKFGDDEGLDVLRFLRRVNPGLRTLAYTARTFDSSKGDFFRLCDGIVKKDSGIRETLEQIEFHLGQVLTPAYQFEALARTIGLTRDQREQVERSLSKAIASPRRKEKALEVAKKFAKTGSEKLLETVVAKVIELGIASATGGS